MNILVSIIIPTHKSAHFLEECLCSIKNQSYKNFEIIVVDNCSPDETKNIALRYTKNVFSWGPERSAQRNYGAKKSKGKYLLFIDSDMELTPKVLEKCMAKFIHNNKLSALVIPEKSVGSGFWAQCKALERSFYQRVDWIEAARCYEKTIFNKLGGFDEKMTGGEDFDLHQKLICKKGKGNVGRISSPIIHHEEIRSFKELMLKKYYYGKGVKRYMRTNKLELNKQANILNRYNLFFSHRNELFKNPLIGIGVLFMKACEFLSIALGTLSRVQ